MAVSAFKRLIDMFKGSDEPEAAKPREAFYPTPDGKPISAASDKDLPVVDIQGLQPVKNWSHPFRVKEKSNPLLQLTSLANATAGFFPLGAGGLWHGGVHFDSGTAGTLEQTSVHCLADGEVVAYRTDKHSAKTVYRVNKVPVMKPFSRNFVLVRHRLEPPRIEGSEKKPPSLVFYSLYMHLQDGSVYEEKPTVERPPFWQQKATYVVPMIAKDKNTVSPEIVGLNVHHQVKKGEVLGLLPRGTAVVVSGEGDYRRLENIPGPLHLLSATRTLLGYVRMDQLELAEDHCRAKVSLSIYAEAVATSKTLGPKLPKGTQVKVSGEGELRKLEFIVQYVHFKSLQVLREPQAFDEVVVLEKPESIRAGDLIGHIGKYQDYAAEHPDEKLHLEIFSGDDVEAFIAECRAWEQGLPSKERTWLKLVKGTVVVPHQDRFSDKQPPAASGAYAISDADLLVPKVVLDGLPPTHKIVVPASDGRKACNWYRLDGLLNDASNNLLNGWVKEEVGVTPWVSPWAWDGYEVIIDYTSPPEFMASFLRSLKRLTDEQLQRYSPMADAGDKGPVKARLLNVVDRDGDNKITAEELRAAIRVPALAQAISQLVVCYESEWLYKPQKWDGLDEIFGHGGSTPHLNWLAEKERIKQLSWWDEVLPKLVLPKDGKVHHLHPLGLVGRFYKEGCACGGGLGKIYSTVSYGKKVVQYGPSYSGSLGLKDYNGWDALVSSGEVTVNERDILVAMSENEGNLDALQSYDSEILSVGAMQKTINSQGSGELPQQVYEFKLAHPDLYEVLFLNCGWEVRAQGRVQYLYYEGVTGSELKKILRKGFTQEAKESGRKAFSKPLAAFSNAIVSDEFLAKQVTDFVRRLRAVLAMSPSGYSAYAIADYLKSKVGRAAVLDQHVNRPAYVRRDFGAALKKYIALNPHVSESPSEWGERHAAYESALLEVYASLREMTHSEKRYRDLKGRL